jgi:CheY-like chemotaxis protein
MRILIVDAVRGDRELEQRCFTSAGHTAIAATDVRAAQEGLDRDPPDVILVDSAFGVGPVATFIKAVRDAHRARHPYIIVLVSRFVGREMATLAASGADDFIRKPLDREELLMRADAKARIATWANVAFGAPEATAAVVGHKIETLRAWSELGAMTARDLGALVGLRFEEVASEPCAADYGARLNLSMATEELEVSFCVRLDAASMKRVALSVFGAEENDEDALNDLAREFTNIVAGTFKSVAGSDGFMLTMGLPLDLRASSADNGAPLAERAFALTDEAGSVRVELCAVLRTNKLKKVSVQELREGMVLARDVRNAAGGLLVPAGRLTRMGIERVTKALAPRAVVDVADAMRRAS